MADRTQNETASGSSYGDWMGGSLEQVNVATLDQDGVASAVERNVVEREAQDDDLGAVRAGAEAEAWRSCRRRSHLVDARSVPRVGSSARRSVMTWRRTVSQSP